jgi:penicillin-insensitive murein DD-endopeptidase
LPETGPTWQAMRLSRNRNWGHPDAIDFIQRLSRLCRDAAGLERALHRRHLAAARRADADRPCLAPDGLDADIWMLPAANGWT